MTAQTSTERDVARLLARTMKAQNAAADPSSSVWVSANAGTGKTHVLTSRTLRLLLAGTPPERILCLTYTKAAAAEMSTRVFDRLARWVTMPSHLLSGELEKLTGQVAGDDDLIRARTLFTKAIETPGGLKVQTIHAFCERLLQRFPLEAGVPPGFHILDDDLGGRLRREAIDAVLRSATRPGAGALGAALKTAVAFAADDRFDEVLAEALNRRDWLEDAVRMLELGDLGEDSRGEDALGETLRAYEGSLREHFEVGVKDTLESIAAAQADVLSDKVLGRAVSVLSGGKKSDQSLADALQSVIAADGCQQRVAALAAALLTKAGEPRSDRGFITKDVRAAEPGMTDMLVNARDLFANLRRRETALRVIDATLALIRLASAAMQHYTNAKAQRAALDFEDLIARTGNLLADSAQADWVLYKLDGGLDHILVDESQDTSRAQWRIIEALAREFFSGEGARDDARTLFAVGDEKQSIYSFQGAAPEMFAQMGATFEDLAHHSGAKWDAVPLTLSFRTVEPILSAVDTVLADPQRTPGVRMDESKPLEHAAKRIGEAGLVEVWPTEAPNDVGPGDPWRPLEEQGDTTPVARLAERIGETIAHWLQSGEKLTSQDRPIEPGDILVLLRKRNPFAAPLVAALKARGIAVAGADRIRLTEQIAVQDLMALGDFLTLPEDDLALACLLKSPLIGFDDDDLFQLSAFEEDGAWRTRSGSLWRSLLASRAMDERFETAADQLVAWRKRADFQPPYEFFAQVLDSDGMRTRILARLGSEACDPIEAFLDLTLQYDELEPPSLSGFLSWLRSGKREIKRDMDQGANEVRVMTVHGSKGLEAPIVILADTCTTSSPGGGREALVDLSSNHGGQRGDPPQAFAWQIKGSSKHPTLAAAKGRAQALDTQELNRLLYVAMTRARDRLYVCGFENRRGRAQGCWYDLIGEALEPLLEDTVDFAGRAVQRLSCAQTVAVEKPEAGPAKDVGVLPLPDWAHRDAPSAKALSVPLAPSRLAPYDMDSEGEPAQAGPSPERERDARAAALCDEPAAPRPAITADERRFLRGTVTHQLLEHLPKLPEASREAAARAFIDTRGAVLPPQVRSSILSETLGILTDPEFAELFGSKSRAEVAIAAEIAHPDSQALPLKISGQVDRLAEVGGDIMIIDYKTNRPPPKTLAGIPEAYILQLGAYRLAIREIYPGRRIRAAILWTMHARLVEVPEARLEAIVAQLWDIRPGSA